MARRGGGQLLDMSMNKTLASTIIAACAVAFAACDDEIRWDTTGDAPVSSDFAGMYILCEGLFNMNNSTLSYYDFTSGTMLSFQDPGMAGADKTSHDFFKMVNGRRLGDTANDLQRYGAKLWCVVNVSSQVEVMDLHSGRSLRQIPLFGEDGAGRQPRSIAFSGSKAYVCNFDGTVAMIDTASLAVERYVTVGRNPDELCVAAGKLYVSNSGGLDEANPDNTVSVIDLTTFTETKRITVGYNPGAIGADEAGNLYVVSRGRYDYATGDYDCRLHRIDTQADTVVATMDVPVMNFCIAGSRAYMYSYDSEHETIKVMDTATGTIIDDSFVKDGTTFTHAYQIAVNPYTGDVYVADAQNYTVNGTVTCFGQDGRRRFTIDACGINPNSMVFVGDKVQAGDGGGSTEPDDEGFHIDRVLDYTPGAGQFVNQLPPYTAGDDAAAMRAKCLDRLSRGQLVSLGGFGGSITVGFDRPIANKEGECDFRVLGNAIDGSAEPGIVMVARDDNGNGVADDEWYELRGSEYANPATLHAYAVTYHRPAADTDPVRWTDNMGSEGYIERTIHPQSFYPGWITADSYTLTGERLPDNGTWDAARGMWVMAAYAYGYADNQPNSGEGSCMDIGWAVNADGEAVRLDAVDFVRIVTAVNQQIPTGLVGELSTEVAGIVPIE